MSSIDIRWTRKVVFVSELQTAGHLPSRFVRRPAPPEETKAHRSSRVSVHPLQRCFFRRSKRFRIADLSSIGVSSCLDSSAARIKLCSRTCWTLQRLHFLGGLRPCAVQERSDWFVHSFRRLNPGSVSDIIEGEQPGIRQYQCPFSSAAVASAAIFGAVDNQNGRLYFREIF